MAIESPQNNLFPIVVTNTPFTSQTLPAGTTAYQQTGIFGTPIGLLVSLTLTPQYIKVIQTVNGLRRIYG